MHDTIDARRHRPDPLEPLRARPDWEPAMARLRELDTRHGAAARAAAADYGRVYAGRRGAMVVDVVASRQRAYQSRVAGIVRRWEGEAGAPTLAWLAANPPDKAALGLMAGEPETMRTVAGNLADFARVRGVDEDEGCWLWASEVEGLEHAYRLDPVVGAVAGIGPALFAYLRMRCGASAIKPDVRVRNALRRLGFPAPDDHAVLVVAGAAAAELGVGLLVLDQLLWSAD